MIRLCGEQNESVRKRGRVLEIADEDTPRVVRITRIDLFLARFRLPSLLIMFFFNHFNRPDRSIPVAAQGRCSFSFTFPKFSARVHTPSHPHLSLSLSLSLSHKTRHIEISEGRRLRRRVDFSLFLSLSSLVSFEKEFRRSRRSLSHSRFAHCLQSDESSHWRERASAFSSFLSVSLGPISFHSSAFPPLFRLSFYTE